MPSIYNVIDLETTGLDYKLDKILEIGAVRLLDGAPVAEFHALLNPGVQLRPSNIAIHGITPEMVRDCPALADVLPTFLQFLGDAPVVAHNAAFDSNFLNFATMQLLGQAFEVELVDTMELAREVFPREKALSLERLLQLMEKPAENLHRALNDARALASIYPELDRRYLQKLEWHR
ncbi:MAG: 3'-5' exonuclease, partial [Cyanobacteria bacterium REEB65]|nr:3'-5' exonuclease [Cyanobacteria bacterium REEB65]